eukprot:jgi/Mesen1/3877/ME000208S02891
MEAGTLENAPLLDTQSPALHARSLQSPSTPKHVTASENEAQQNASNREAFDILDAELDIPPRSPAHRHQKWPASWICWLLSPILNVFSWLEKLRHAFGLPLVLVVMVAYGITQGFAESLGDLASKYYWKNVQLLQPAVSQAYDAMAGIPWVLKPVYGLITDTYPIAGYQRWPYLVIMGTLGAICFACLAYLPAVTPLFAAGLLTGVSFATAFPDVVVDALVAQQSRTVPALAGDLQASNWQSICSPLCLVMEGAPSPQLSLSWGALAFGGLCGYSVSGPTVHNIGPRGGFGVLALAPSLLVVAALMLPEAPVKADGKEKGHLGALVRSGQLLARTVRRPSIWRPAIYLFLANGATSPDIGEALFYWYTDADKGPGFSENFMGFLYAMGYAGMLLGVAAYNTWFKMYPYRRMLFLAQLLVVFCGSMDLILITGLNLRLGIPNHTFVVGEKTLSHALTRLQIMPMLVLAAKLCPPGIEGTLFAFLMAVTNLGRGAGAWEGALLLSWAGVRRGEFGNLWLAALIRTSLRVIPLAFLFLVPDGSPADEMAFDLEPQEEHESEQQHDRQQMLEKNSRLEANHGRLVEEGVAAVNVVSDREVEESQV